MIALPTPLTKNREPDLSIVLGATREIAASPAARAPRRPRVDDLPGNDSGGASPDPRGERARGRTRVLPRLQPRARRSRPDRLDDEEHAQGRRRPDPRLHRAGGRLLPPRARHGRSRLLAGRRGAREAAREHLPLRQHRARQRARSALRPDRRGRLGGRRGGVDEAVRLHELQARPRPRWTLPSGRSVLPLLEGARVRLLHGVHRARRQGEREHAVVLLAEDRAGAQRARAARSRTASVHLVGVSYKADVGDLRESPALKLIELLREGGARVSYTDPHVPVLADHGLETRRARDGCSRTRTASSS